MAQNPLTPPKSEKQNQHYIPRWWLKAFADQKGNIWGVRGHKVGIEAAGDIMNGDWIYTIFDAWWRPSDAVEDNLSKIEGTASRLFRRIEKKGPSGDEDWSSMLWFIALTICRHPQAMGRGHELTKELGIFLQEAASYAHAEAFAAAFETRFGSRPPEEMYPYVSAAPQEVIDDTILHLLGLAAYDPQLPATDALLATDQVAKAIGKHDCRLLSAPADHHFVLGDHPFPVRDLTLGFTIPLSKTLALEVRPTAESPPLRVSDVATVVEVKASNERQAAMAKALVIGSDRAALSRLAPVPRP